MNTPDKDDDLLVNHNHVIPYKSGVESDQTYWRLFTRGIQFALIIHTTFIVLFYFLGAVSMALVNIGSVALYAFCLWLLVKKLNRPVIVLCWIEVIGHAVLAVKTFGWDSGFHYYLLLFIPLVFASTTRKLGIIMTLTILISLIYIVMDASMHFETPSIVVSEMALDLLRYTNIFVCFIFLGYVTYLYIHMVSEAEDNLTLMATTDPLTGLYNRRYLLELAEYELKQFKRSNVPFSIIISDIDDFKAINDSYGHIAGDQALISASKCLRSILREKDSIARWGGEEFLILLPETDIINATEIAGRCRNAINSSLVQTRKHKFTINMTFGVCECKIDEYIDNCVARADKALYKGKQSGKNRVVVAARDMTGGTG